MCRLDLLIWLLLFIGCVQPPKPATATCGLPSCVQTPSTTLPTTPSVSAMPTATVESQPPMPRMEVVDAATQQAPDASRASPEPDAAPLSDASVAPIKPSPDSTVVIAQPQDDAQGLFDPVPVISGAARAAPPRDPRARRLSRGARRDRVRGRTTP